MALDWSFSPNAGNRKCRRRVNGTAASHENFSALAFHVQYSFGSIPGSEGEKSAGGLRLYVAAEPRTPPGPRMISQIGYGCTCMVFVGRIPRRTKAGDLGLRSFSICHLPLVLPGLRDVGWSGSSFRVWWQLSRTFSFLYLVEILGKPAGILGVYNFEPKVCAEISLVIFDKTLRRRGYGKRIFLLAASILSRHASIKRVLVMVDPDNTVALSFWTSLNFREDHLRGKRRVLGLDLKPDDEGLHI
jgi:ribosomal protein S18 acetylase RimI-like enzyme